MNDKAMEAMAAAATEWDRVAAGCEVEADLWRQAAECARRGDMDGVSKFRARAMTTDRSTELADRLFASVGERDPDTWAKFCTSTADSLSPAQARLALQVHRLVCPTGDCAVDEALRRRVGQR